MPFDWRKLQDKRLEKWDNVKHRAELTALVLKDRETREDGRRVTQTNLLALTWVLGYCLFDEQVHHEAINFFPPKQPSLTLTEWILESNKQYLRIGSLLLPRGVYKTTLSLTNCVQLLICWPMTVAILIMCGRSDLAEDFIMQVAGFFYRPNSKATPTLFQALWPELCVDRKPDANGFTTAKRQTDPPIIEPAIWGESIEAGTSGYHPNILIADDLHNNRNSRTFDARSAITKKYKLAKKVLMPVGSEIRIGTIYGSGDIFTDEVLSTKPGTIRRVLRPAIRRKDGERIDENGFPDEDEVELCFPSILNYDFLATEYFADFDTFATQYLLDEYGGLEVVFPQKEMMAAMVEERAIPLEGKIIVQWRFPCMRRGWYTACCAVGQIYRNRCYIIDTDEGHYKPSSLAKLVVNNARKHNVHRVSIEDSPGARLMIPAIQNYALTTGWHVGMDWIGGGGDEESEEDSGMRDLRIRNIEAVLSSGRLLFFAGLKHVRRLMMEFTQYGTIPDFGMPDVIARVVDHLPQSIAADDLGEENLAWKAAQERDHFNMVYNRGQYAPPEPEPEEVEEEEFEGEFTDEGLENIMPGLRG
jgi:hypothetical protein